MSNVKISQSVAEQAVLGGLILDNSYWLDVKDLLNPDDFAFLEHRPIYQAINERLEANQLADFVTLSTAKGVDLDLLSLIIQHTNAPQNTLLYAEIVKSYSVTKNMIEQLKQAAFDLEQGDKKPHEVAQKLIEQQETITRHQQRDRFMFTEIKTIKIKPLDWLIEDFVESNSLTEVFGAPESGKSLLAIDWGLSVAAGIAWQGHRTKQGAVFYVAGEGQNGLARRFGAWCNHHGLSIEDLPFYRSEQAAAFYNIHSAISVERAIEQVTQKRKIEPRLIIIDTLARNFGGNENSTEDMNQFIAHLDKHLRTRFNATVLLVHHTGHGSSERGRGSSALKAAVDTEYSMVKNDAGIINLSCTKMKDAPHPTPKSFQINSVSLNIADEKGYPANGPVLVEATFTPEEPKTVLGKWEQLGISSLEILQAEARESFIEEGENPNDAKVSVLTWRERLGMPKQRFHDVKKSLQNKGLVIIENGYVSLVEDIQD